MAKNQITMQTIEEIVQWLDSKFESMHPTQDWYKYKKWYLNRYSYYGADYGIQLMYREGRLGRNIPMGRSDDTN